MRVRLIAVAVATTTMVALAFLVPLALLVRSVARDRALTAAEHDAESLAPVLALTDEPGTIVAAAEGTVAGEDGRLTVFLPDGRVVGTGAAPPPPAAAVAAAGENLELARQGRAFFSRAPDGGRAFFVPVVGGGGTAVVRVDVPDEELTRGVAQSWTILGLLALGLVGAAVVVADRLASSVVRPVLRLAGAADRLGAGDLSTRVDPGGPAEVAAVGRAFNLLAGRVKSLLEAERELVADLSHRLRTPLTVLRLEADATADVDARRRLGDATADLERVVTEVIEEARRPIRAGTGAPADLAAVARERTEFWGALAEEQGRRWEARLPEGPCPVPAAAGDLAGALDAVLGNVFAHTPEGTPFSVAVERAGGGWRLVVEDGGPGLPNDAVVERGRSGAGSTGLGLDIARRTAEAAGGRLGLGAAAGRGGARVELEFPPAAP